VSLVLAAVIAFAPGVAGAQLRRVPGPPPGDAPGTPPPASLPRFPFVGSWAGSMTLTEGPRADHPVPLTIAWNVADTATRAYSGATIHPDDARVSHLETVVRGGEMRWKQPNSGGGFWVYSARLVSPDSIAGTVILRDWPQLSPGAPAPRGTFALARRRARP
jgi:hypothetical protein